MATRGAGTTVGDSNLPEHRGGRGEKTAKSGSKRAGLSLKGRGLAYLAQRDHSRVELARKLLPHARAMVLTELAETPRSNDPNYLNGPTGPTGPSGPGDQTTLADELEPSNAAVAKLTAAERVSEVLDWLQAHDYLSDARFAESRTHARSAKFGNLRIRLELSQHGVSLQPEAVQRLKETEFERARELQARKFTSAPSTAAEYAKQSRFLAGRGFSGEAVRQVMRLVGWAAAENSNADAEPT